MKHTSCHTKQAQLLGEYLASAGVEDKINSGKNTSPFFIGAHPFLSDMARMVDRYPENRKAVDYLLCGLLISKDVDKFYKVFSLLYKPFSVKLPRYYEEALLVLATQHPDILRRYPVGQEVVKDFNSFHALLKGGTMNQKMLEINYRDSFVVLLLYEGSEEIGGELKRESSYLTMCLSTKKTPFKRIGTFLLI